MKVKWLVVGAALAVPLLPFSAQAASDGGLLELINAYRANPPSCEGKQSGPLPPLAPEPALAKIKLSDQRELLDPIRESGYRASRAEALKLTGPANANDVMRILQERNCHLLLSSQYSVAGISQHGREWRIVLAQPLLDRDLRDWNEAGRQVLELVNAARASERRCGGERFAPAPALRWNEKLAVTARKHSEDMAAHQYFNHAGRDGSTVATRARQEGYMWRRIGENIAAGQGSPQEVVDGWLASPGHCANIMNGKFSEMGAAYALNKKGNVAIYWTQVFGTPR